MLKIVKYPSAILKKRAEEVGELSRDLLSLVSGMEAAMEKNQGIGLAAPQVGVPRRVMVVKEEKRNHAFFNPKILEKSKKTEVDEEGCLSLPGLFLPIKRAQSIRVACSTKEGKPIIIEAKDLAARVFQHEIDHLEGKLIIDRLTPFKRWKIRKELDQIKKTGRVKKQ